MQYIVILILVVIFSLPTHSQQWNFSASNVLKPVVVETQKTVNSIPVISQPIEVDTYTVVRVTDGDTITVNYRGRLTSVRIIGYNSPEKWTKKTGHTECYGEEASVYAHKLLDGQRVRLVFDESQATNDKYGRLLAHVFLLDGRYYEEEAIKNGYGFRYVFNNTPSKYDATLKASEDYARTNTNGLWSACK